jgi:hypothetical protein
MSWTVWSYCIVCQLIVQTELSSSILISLGSLKDDESFNNFGFSWKKFEVSDGETQVWLDIHDDAFGAENFGNTPVLSKSSRVRWSLSPGHNRSTFRPHKKSHSIYCVIRVIKRHYIQVVLVTSPYSMLPEYVTINKYKDHNTFQDLVIYSNISIVQWFRVQ